MVIRRNPGPSHGMGGQCISDMTRVLIFKKNNKLKQRCFSLKKKLDMKIPD